MGIAATGETLARRPDHDAAVTSARKTVSSQRHSVIVLAQAEPDSDAHARLLQTPRARQHCLFTHSQARNDRRAAYRMTSS